MAHSRTCDETFEELLHKQKRNVKKTKRKKEDISLKKTKNKHLASFQFRNPSLNCVRVVEVCGGDEKEQRWSCGRRTQWACSYEFKSPEGERAHMEHLEKRSSFFSVAVE